MSLMTINGLAAEINTPTALQGDSLHSLPPHAQVAAFVVDEYPACPDVWEHGSDKASSYFVSLEAGKGMWFDFTHNQHNKYHVAIVISVQGVNPITGKPITELCLVQHQKQCPIHKVDFQQDRYCPKCNYKWPAQNYIATTTGEIHLWLDGFRSEDGEIRQYIISEEQARGIAKQIEDRDPEFKRVWAIGFAFYLSKDPKPTPPTTPVRMASNWQVGSSTMGLGRSFTSLDSYNSRHYHAVPNTPTKSYIQSPESQNELHSNLDTPGSNSCKTTAPVNRGSVLKRAGMGKRSIGALSTAPMRPIEKVVEKTKLEVGAGARINQDIGIDPNPIDFWQEEPAGMIYVNFTDPDTLKQILDAGKRQDAIDGALNEMKVGN